MSTTLDSNGAVIAITFSGTNAANDVNSIKAYDKFQFSDGVSGQPDMRFLTFIGHVTSQSPVQFRATADATSTAGSQVTVNIFPPLQAPSGNSQNINNPIVAGMQVTVLPSHRCGLIMSGDPLFLAMPKLPDEEPYSTVSMVDKDSGASIRHYWGSQLGMDNRVYVRDSTWGSTLIAEDSMRMIFPL